MKPTPTDGDGTKNRPRQRHVTLPVRPAAGGGVEFESGVVGAVPRCAWRGPGRSQRQLGGWWVPHSPERRAGWTKLLACRRGNPASQTTTGGSEKKNTGEDCARFKLYWSQCYLISMQLQFWCYFIMCMEKQDKNAQDTLPSSRKRTLVSDDYNSSWAAHEYV